MANPQKRQLPVKTESFPPSGVKKQKFDDTASSTFSTENTSTIASISADLNPLDDANVLRFQRRAMCLTIAEKNRLIDSLQHSVDQSSKQRSRAESRLSSMIESFDQLQTDLQILLDRVAPNLHQSNYQAVKQERFGSSSLQSDAILRLLQSDDNDSNMADDSSDHDNEWDSALRSKRSHIQTIFHNVIDVLQKQQAPQPVNFDSLTSSLEKQHREDNRLISSIRTSLAATEQKLVESEQKAQALQDEIKKALRQRDRFELDCSMARKAVEAAESQIGKNGPILSASPNAGTHSSPRSSPDSLVSSSQLDETRVELSDMSAENELLQTQITNLYEEIRQLRAERDEANIALTNVQAPGASDEIVLASHQYRSLVAESTKMKADIESLNAAVDAGTQEVAEQKALNEKDREHFKQQIDRITKAFQEKESSMIQTVAEAREACANAEHERDGAVQSKSISITEAEETQARLRALVEQLQTQLHEAHNSLAAYTSFIDPNQRRFIHSERHWFSLFHHKQQQWRKLEAFLISQLGESQLTKVRQECESLDSILSVDLERAIEGEFVDDSGLSDELDELATSQTELNERLAKALISLAEAEKERQVWREEKLSATTQASIVRTEILALKRNVNFKTEEIEKLREHNLSLSNQVRSQEDASRAKDIALATAHQTIKDLKKSIDELTSKLDKVTLELATAQQQITSYKSKYNAEVHKISALQDKSIKQSNDLHNQISNLNSQLTKAKQQSSGQSSVQSNGGTGDELLVVKRRLKCSVCSKNDKDTVITKCWHLFCHGCVEENLTTRNRKCPGCKTKFDKNDVQRVYGLE